MKILEKPTITRTEHRKVTLSIDFPISEAEDLEQLIGNVEEGNYTITFKKAYKGRSLSANRYAWKLMSLIAEERGINVVEVYRQEIAGMHTFYTVEVASEACNAFMESWRSRGIGWLAEILSISEKPGFIDVRCVYGSSVFDQREMSIFIDNIIQDCEALGIKTESPEWIEKRLSLWGEKRGESKINL